MTLDTFALGSCNLRSAANASMAVIDALQNYPAHEQAAGLAAAFLLMTERFKLRVPDTCAVASNLIFAAEGKRPEFKAVEHYMREEWKS